jgi:hypothetical protein
MDLIFYGSLEKLGYIKLAEIFNAEIEIRKNPIAANAERKNRLAQVKNTPNGFFKFFPWQINSEIFQYINENYAVIGLSRENVFEQVLSWYISDQTDCWAVWNQETTLKYQALLDRKLFFPKFKFEQFMSEFATYDFLLSHFKNVVKTYTYENIIATHPKTILEELKLPYDAAPDLPLKQNLENKLQLFENVEDIEEWFTYDYKSRISDCNNFQARLPYWG